MQLVIIAVGSRMPTWVNSAFQDYTKRMPAELPIELREIKPEPRSAQRGAHFLMQAEAQRIRAALPKRRVVVALDERGQEFSTVELAARLERWRAESDPVFWIIGGADGLDAELKAEASVCLSLSRLTLPHAMVRVILAEQLYRAWSLTQNHPYHRA